LPGAGGAALPRSDVAGARRDSVVSIDSIPSEQKIINKLR
jgi:hypothetical protein